MRYIADSDGYVKEVSFGADIVCNGQECTEYTGDVPTGYTSLEAWFLAEGEKLYRWKIVSGNLTLDSTAVAPSDPPPVADYIVETNTSGIWTYRKWNSGLAECWGRHTSNIAMTTATGYLYYGTGQISYPSGLFISEPDVDITARSTYGVMINANDSASATSCIFYALCASSTTATVSAMIYARGKWK